MLRRLAVFCGANPGSSADYLQAADALGRAMVRRRIGLVFGGGNVGLMGAIADAVIEEGGTAVGIIPEALMAREVGHARLTELCVVDGMHTRKRMMAERADGYVAMPGGIGTLDELFDAIVPRQLGLHAKPLAMLDVAGYFQPVQRLFEHMVESGFLSVEHRGLAVCESDPEALLDAMGANTILHIAARDSVVRAQQMGSYRADTLESEGFIHFSWPSQVERVANERFRGRQDVVLLAVDRRRVVAPIQYENTEGFTEKFPHVYGALNLDAVQHVHALAPDADGRHAFERWLREGQEVVL